MEKKHLILIVDDIKENLRLLRKIIESMDYNVQEAANGKEGLEIARLQNPDLIISDILMPVMDGFRFCKGVKKDNKLKNIPFIFYTATYTSKKDEEFALKLGAEKFIIKPLEPNKFIKIIQSIVRDVEKGKVKIKEPALKEDKEVFKLYSERLVNKLEERMLDLENEVTNRKQATKTLKESEEKYRTLVEKMEEGIASVDENENFTFVNQATCKIFGYSKKEILKMNLKDLTTPQEFKRVRQQTSVRKTGKPSKYELKIITKDGSHSIISVTSSPLFDNNKKYLGAFGIFQDITERKQAEERIAYLNLVLRSVRDVNQLITKEKDRNVLIKQSCEIFTRNRGYNKALIAIFDENNKLDIAVQSGIGRDFQLLKNDMKRGKLYNCIRKALKQPEIILIENPLVECKDCPISDVCEGRSTISVRLEYKNKVYGLLSVSIEKKYLCDEEMLDLFGEVTGDIAFALYRMDLEAAHKKSEKIQKVLYDISNALNTIDKMHDLYSKIREYLGNVIDTTNFYVALYDKETGIISLPYMVDENKVFTSFPSGKTLTDYVIRTGKPLLADEEVSEKLTQGGEAETIGPLSKIWLGVPLKIENEVIGSITVQSYTDASLYTEKDMEILEFVSGQIAIAIKHKQDEEKIRKNLAEKNVLLQEIHHRVKNNMQVISSMLGLQSAYITDKRVLELFQNSRGRVKAMALIHDALYRSQDLAHIDFANYIRQLTTRIFISYGANSSLIKLKTDIQDVWLDISMAILCGLIINKLVSNSLKYAFPAGRKGEISVSLTYKNEIFTLCVKDNGIGIADEIDFENPKTLGLLLVHSLTQQLNGSLNLEKVKGTLFKITFKKIELKTFGKNT